MLHPAEREAAQERAEEVRPHEIAVAGHSSRTFKAMRLTRHSRAIGGCVMLGSLQLRAPPAHPSHPYSSSTENMSRRTMRLARSKSTSLYAACACFS
eukprot:2559230-Prymnesium_polylepis.3